MRKGLIEYFVLLVISKEAIYTSDILKALIDSNLILVEGTIYPLLSRLTKEGVLKYEWVESAEGPPRKYYSLTVKGKKLLKSADLSWNSIKKSIKFLKERNEKRD